MVLEVKVLKVEHEGVKEARKTIPFIQDADVVSPEVALMPEEAAKSFESFWNHALSSGWTWDRPRFQAGLKERIPCYNSGGIKQFFDKVYEYAYRSGKSLFFLERSLPEKTEKIKKKINELIGSGATRKMILQGDLDVLLRYTWNSNSEFIKANDSRDKIMGSNISAAEEYLRTNYPGLRDKSTIKLVTCVGSMHSPERYTNVQCVVHDLHPHQSYGHQLIKAIMDGKSLDEAKHTLLQYVASVPLKFPESDVKGLSQEKLEAKMREVMLLLRAVSLSAS